jgi:acyl-CoA synthetase (AMP-forming)/AMP-acid ligase II
VPLALAAPAAIAGLAYLNAKIQLSYDYRLIGTGVKSQIKIKRRLKRDEINPFYFLEEHAKGPLSDKTLLIFDDRRWSYQAVYETVLKYGTWLKTKYEIKPKEIVAINFMNSDKFIFLWLGLWAIGAKPAFINYNLTDNAFLHCVNVSTSRLVLIDPQVYYRLSQQVWDQLPDVLCEVFSPEFEAEVMSTIGVREPNSTRSEDRVSNLGMIVFTSGTTGLPKGAVVSWNKIILGSMIVHGWSGFGQDDTFYTVSWQLP